MGNREKNEKSILDTIAKAIPLLSELEQEKLLSFGEGIAFIKSRQMETEPKKTA